MSGLRFLPWVRDGLAGGLPSGAARAAVEVGLTVSRGTDLLPVAPVTVTLLGPGDVTGVDPGQIIRAFPAPDATGVETTGFAAVEFDRPDLPWMFSPAAPTSGDGCGPGWCWWWCPRPTPSSPPPTAPAPRPPC